MRRELTDDERDAWAEHLAWEPDKHEAPPGFDRLETGLGVFRALLEQYRQLLQDSIHETWGRDWPRHADDEREALRALQAECDAWEARYTDALARGGRSGT